MRKKAEVDEPPPSPVMTLSEVAAYLKVTPGTIYRLLKRNEIPGFKLSRRAWRCNRESIDQWRFTASRCRTSK